VQINVRSLEPGDVDDLVALSVRAWAPVHASMAAALGDRLNSRVYPDWAAAQAADVAAACHDPGTKVSVAIDNQRIVGFVSVVINDPGTGEIGMIAVDPAAQRRGVARRLTEHALAQLRAAACDLATVATGGDDGHAPARALYESAGFTPLPLVRYYLQL
jgi:ribosomal protein S18 acetylase RimI-like enzyme